jgi:hypothetical protein
MKSENILRFAIKSIIKEQIENIRLGNHYKKYLDNISFNSEKIPPKKSDYKESYLITNKKNAPIFKGVLNVFNDGRAVFIAKYTTYSGVENNYINYFNKDGLEIIHKNDSAKEEKKYFENH